MAEDATLGNLLYYIRMNNADVKEKINQTAGFVQDLEKRFDDNKKELQDWGNAFKITTQETLTQIKKVIQDNQQLIKTLNSRGQAEKQAAQTAKQQAQQIAADKKLAAQQSLIAEKSAAQQALEAAKVATQQTLLDYRYGLQQKLQDSRLNAQATLQNDKMANEKKLQDERLAAQQSVASAKIVAQQKLQADKQAFQVSREEARKTAQEKARADREAAQSAKQAAEDSKAAWKGIAVASSVALAALIVQIKDIAKATIDMQNSLLGLQSTAKSWGQDIDAATKAAQDLAADGLMTVADAAVGLKNLLASGFGLDQAITLMKGFKDIAVFNRQASLGFGEAVRGATEGIKNGNSILVDNIGLTKNLSIIMKEMGFKETDVMNVTSDLNIRMAMYKGLLKEVAPYQGDAAKAAGTLGGQMAKTSTSAMMAKSAIGDALEPVLINVNKTMQSVWRTAESLAKTFPTLTAAITAATVAFTALLSVIAAAKALSTIKLIIDSIKLLSGPVGWFIAGVSLIAGAISAYQTAVAKARQEQQKMIDSTTREYTSLKGLITQYEELSKKTSKTAQDKKTMHDLSEKIAKLFPELIKGYDSEKNAIIDMAKYQEELNKKLAAALELRRKNNEEEIKSLRISILRLEQQRDTLARQQNMELFGGRKTIAEQDAYLAQRIRMDNPNRTYTDSQMKEAIKQYRANFGASVTEIDKMISSQKTRINDLVRQGGRIPETNTNAVTTTSTKATKDTRTAYDIAKDQFEIYAKTNPELEAQLNYWEKIVGKINKLPKELDDYKAKLEELRAKVKEEATKSAEARSEELKKGLDKELADLKSKEREDLRIHSKGSQAYNDITATYQAKRAKLFDKYGKESEAQQYDLWASLAKASGKFQDAEVYTEMASYTRQLENDELTKDQMQAIEENHRQALLKIQKEYTDKSFELQNASSKAELDAQLETLDAQQKALQSQPDTIENRAKILALERQIVDVKKKEIQLDIDDALRQLDRAKAEGNTNRILELQTEIRNWNTQLAHYENEYTQKATENAKNTTDAIRDQAAEQKKADNDRQIAELEYEKGLISTNANTIQNRMAILDYEKQINEKKIENLQIDLVNLAVQKKIADDIGDTVHSLQLQTQITDILTQIYGLKGAAETSNQAKRLAKETYDELQNAVSSAIITGFDEGGKSALDNFADYLKQKLKKNVADAIAEAFMSSSMGQGLQSMTGTLTNFIGSIFGKAGAATSGAATSTAAASVAGTAAAGTAAASGGSGTGILGSISNFFKTNKTAGAIGNLGMGTLLGSLVGGGGGEATTGAALGSLLGLALPGLGTALGGVLGGLFGSMFGGSESSYEISANTAKLDIDFAEANFKNVTLPKTYMNSSTGTTKNSNSVAPVVQINVQGNVVTERDLQKTMEDTANEVYSARTVAGSKWSEATVNGVDINDY